MPTPMLTGYTNLENTRLVPTLSISRAFPAHPPLPRRLVIHWKYELPMIKKLTKHGNSLALVIDRPILELLNIDPDTPLDVSTDGKQLIIATAKPSARRKKFEAAQESAHRRYGRAFKKLAE